MKKFLYLCGMMLLCINMMARIDVNDDNWECFINEDFSGIRSWDSHWEDTKDTPNYTPLWRCFAHEMWNFGVTGDIKHERHVYQKSNAVFDTNNQTLKLLGDFKSQNSLWCGDGYEPAPWNKYCHFCDPIQDQHPFVHYHSAMIESIDPVGYGYYEVECKMPTHKGAYSAFWFWSNLGNKYNEIDVFERGEQHCYQNPEKQTISGIWYNPYGTNLKPLGNIPGAQRYGHYLNTLHSEVPNLESYHTFGCLWMPERVVFYVDNEAISEFNDPEKIPPHPMWLKITHLEDKDARIYPAKNNDTIWGDWHDEMTINYVRGYRLKTNRDEDVAVRSVSDFNNFVYSTKHTISMGGLSSILTIPIGSNFTMRAVESIIIDSNFELPLGAEMTLMVHDCPQCSMEGVELPSYDCGMDKENE